MSRANQVTRACLKYLNTIGMAWRQNNGVAKFDNRVVVFTRKGASDIIGLLNSGTFLAVEVKIGNDKLSYHQVDFLLRVMESGGFVSIVSDVDVLIDNIESWKADKNSYRTSLSVVLEEKLKKLLVRKPCKKKF